MRDAFLWWNVWLHNFDSADGEDRLTEAMSRIVDRRQPTVISLQEVVADRNGAGAVAGLLAHAGYHSHFESVSQRGSRRHMGNLIAVREAHRYRTFDCGSCGGRRTPLQVVKLIDRASQIAVGNVHWLMMRPVFEIHRWRQMSAMLAIIDRLDTGGVPLIVGGDLNTAAHHPYMLRLKRHLHVLRNKRPTWWYRARPRLVKASLDHVFSTKPLPGSLELLDPGPSDHAPILMAWPGPGDRSTDY